MKCTVRRDEDGGLQLWFPPDARGAVGKENLPDDTLGAAVLTATLRKHDAAFTDSCSQTLLQPVMCHFWYMFILSDKHPGVAVRFQSNFQDLMHPVKSIWSISQTSVDKEIALWKTNTLVLVCLSPAGEAPCVQEHLVHMECAWDNVLLKSRKSGYKVCTLFIGLTDENRILPLTGLCTCPLFIRALTAFHAGSLSCSVPLQTSCGSSCLSQLSHSPQEFLQLEVLPKTPMVDTALQYCCQSQEVQAETSLKFGGILKLEFSKPRGSLSTAIWSASLIKCKYQKCSVQVI